MEALAGIAAVSLCVAFTIASALDFHSTLTMLRIGGREKTRLVIWLIETLGAGPGLFVAKALGIAAIWGVWWFGGWASVPLQVALLLLCAYYLVTVQNNYAEIRRQREINNG